MQPMDIDQHPSSGILDAEYDAKMTGVEMTMMNYLIPLAMEPLAYSTLELFYFFVLE
jgi:hypothetical protein